MIIQGSNTPIKLTFSAAMTSATAFSAVLSANGSVFKSWDLDDVTVSGTQVSLPQTEAETAEYPAGKCALDVKWLNASGIQFAESVPLTVLGRADRGVALIEEDDD